MGTCPACGAEKSHIGKHFALSDCGYPEIDAETLEILTGLLMGDGNISQPNSGNCTFRLSMINKKFLDHLDNQLGWLSNGVKLSKTAEQSSKSSIGYKNPDNYSDVYRLNTTAHPKFNEMREWYDSGEKMYPNDLQLTPRILEMWYVSDGSLNTTDASPSANIRVWNERNRPDLIKSLFSDTPINSFTFSEDEGRIYFTVDGTSQLMSYIGHNPLPGFEYKYC